MRRPRRRRSDLDTFTIRIATAPLCAAISMQSSPSASRTIYADQPCKRKGFSTVRSTSRRRRSRRGLVEPTRSSMSASYHPGGHRPVRGVRGGRLFQRIAGVRSRQLLELVVKVAVAKRSGTAATGSLPGWVFAAAEEQALASDARPEARACSATRPGPGWWTHGLPPQSGPVTADTPLSAIAAFDGAGWRDDGRDTLSVPRPRPAGHRGSRGAGAPSRTRSVARPRAWPSDTLTGGRVRRLARPAAPRPPPPAPAARPGRPRAAPVPRRRLRPVASVAWRTHRLPPKARRAAAGGCGRMEASERGRGRDSAASHAGGPESRRRERQR